MADSYTISQPGTFGGLWTGIAATITGSINDVVVDFTGTTQTLFTSPSLLVPVLATHSATLGSTFKIQVEGLWVIKAIIQSAQAAGAILAAIGIDNVAGELIADPPVEGTRFLDRSLVINSGADSWELKMITTPIVITREQANDPTAAIIRVLASNNGGAGATDASVTAAACSLRMTRIGDIPGKHRG